VPAKAGRIEVYLVKRGKAPADSCAASWDAQDLAILALIAREVDEIAPDLPPEVRQGLLSRALDSDAWEISADGVIRVDRAKLELLIQVVRRRPVRGLVRGVLAIEQRKLLAHWPLRFTTPRRRPETTWATAAPAVGAPHVPPGPARLLEVPTPARNLAH
jgi:hypothetical protein